MSTMNSEVYEQACAAYYEVCDLEPSARLQRLEELNLGEAARAEVLSLLAIEEQGDRFSDESLGGCGLQLIEDRMDKSTHQDIPESMGAYRVLEKLGEGGMGIVYSARHQDSNQIVAIKIVRPGMGGEELQKRFKRETNILRQLRHPGIAAFYDSGTVSVEFAGGTTSAPFIAMELVNGEPLRRYVEDRKLSQADRIELIARICDALQSAHEQGVVHRDLKPSNIFVTELPNDPIGQPKVLDFGIAMIADAHTLLATQTGAIIGTLSHMCPEQAAGGKESPEPSWDVYSLGVMAFDLLMGSMPYDLSACSIPEAVHKIQTAELDWSGLLTTNSSGDLPLILAKALEKDSARRYPRAADLALDLRAFLAGQPVTARAPSAFRRAKKWLRRHPIIAMLVGVISVSTVAAGLLWQRTIDDRAAAEQDTQNILSSTSLANQRTAVLRREADYVLRLSDLTYLRGLLASAEDLWPAHPRRLPEFDAWLKRAQPLAGRLQECRKFLQELNRPDAQVRMELEGQQLAWWRETFATLADELEEFARPEVGALAQLEARRQAASTLWQRSIGDHRESWDQAIDEIKNNAAYEGLELEPQLGLVPLGVDPESGLYEFWHIDSGTCPKRDSDSGRLVCGDEDGLILVLLPGGRFMMGASSTEGDEGYDPLAKARDGPVHPVELTPFFISKFEFTQGQWLRTTGHNPSARHAGSESLGTTYTLAHPVEHVNWTSSYQLSRRLNLDLPTEAQWEFAAKGGISSPRYFDVTFEDFPSFENVADQEALSRFPEGKFVFYESWNDGFPLDAPVGSLEPNPYGLYDILGNVHEWCRDVYDKTYYSHSPLKDPCNESVEDPVPHDILRSVRGSSYRQDSRWARSSFRQKLSSDTTVSSSIGFRAARRLDPQ